MSEYENLGYMTKLENFSEETINYLPHHGDIKDCLTTKLRVVFDGSAVIDTGYSLKNIQMLGKSLQDELLTIMLRFRQHVYALTNVEKMYRQILIDHNQRIFKSILGEQIQPNQCLHMR